MATTITAKSHNPIELNENRWIDERGEPCSDGLITLFCAEHISALFTHYAALKTSTSGHTSSDFYYLLQELEALITRTLTAHPTYLDIVEAKFAGKSNSDIQRLLLEKYGVAYTPEYISALYRKKIPKLLAEQAKEDYLIWYYTIAHPELAEWKTCSCCGQTKLAHNRFFSINNSAKDHFYSQCKECRNKKNKRR